MKFSLLDEPKSILCVVNLDFSSVMELCILYELVLAISLLSRDNKQRDAPRKHIQNPIR